MNDRFLNFSADVVRLLMKISNSQFGRQIANQLFRSASSSGANYQEACAGESKKDFTHKLQIVLKELRESLYWLRLIQKLEFISNAEITPLINEADQLCRMIAKSIVTSKKSQS